MQTRWQGLRFHYLNGYVQIFADQQQGLHLALTQQHPLERQERELAPL